MASVAWKDNPDKHDYPAAISYLSLLAPTAQVDKIILRLKAAKVEHHRARDILRAASLPLLSKHDEHVAADLKRARKGKKLSPILLVRGNLDTGVNLEIADGYHRVCAIHHIDEDIDIPCCVTDSTGR